MTNEQPDWKQWIPVYGLYRILKDEFSGKPSLCTDDNIIKSLGSAAYHALVTGTPIIIGLEKLIS